DAVMAIDAATRQSLEILQTQRGQSKNSLRHAIDLTVTAPGARLLANRLAAPLRDAAAINARLDAVSRLVEDTILRAKLRSELKAVPDLARALSRLALERGGPRDLAAIGKAVAVALGLGQKLAGVADLPAVLTGLAAILAQAPDTLAAEFAAALADDLPLLIRDGGFVRTGFDARLDEERALGSETRAVVAALQARLM